MSDTPRTDAKERETRALPSPTHAHYGWKHAREMERELARALRVVEAAQAFAVIEFHPELDKALREWGAGR